jgi:hypothetical protein
MDLGGAAVSFSLGASGYIKFDMGNGHTFMIQWGKLSQVGLSAGNSTGNGTFSPAFTTACYGVYGVAVCPSGFDNGYFALTSVPTTAGFTCDVGSAPSDRDCYWIAIGS